MDDAPLTDEDLERLRKLAGIWKAQDGLAGPDATFALDRLAALVARYDRIAADLVREREARRAVDRALADALQERAHFRSLYNAESTVRSVACRDRDAARRRLALVTHRLARVLAAFPYRVPERWIRKGALDFSWGFRGMVWSRRIDPSTPGTK